MFLPLHFVMIYSESTPFCLSAFCKIFSGTPHLTIFGAPKYAPKMHIWPYLAILGIFNQKSFVWAYLLLSSEFSQELLTYFDCYLILLCFEPSPISLQTEPALPFQGYFDNLRLRKLLLIFRITSLEPEN